MCCLIKDLCLLYFSPTKGGSLLEKGSFLAINVSKVGCVGGGAIIQRLKPGLSILVFLKRHIFDGILYQYKRSVFIR